MQNDKVVKWIIIGYKKVIPIAKFLVIPLIIIFPLLLEQMVVFNDIESAFSNNEWFAFWGSYSGAIITCIVLYITIRHNNKLIKAGLRESEIRREYKEKIEIADYAYRVISLMDYYPCEDKEIKNNFYHFINYDFKMLDFKISRHDNCIYYTLVKELEDKYLEKVEELNNEKGYATSTEVKHVLESMYGEFESKRKEIEDNFDKYKNTILQEMDNKILKNYI